MTNSRAVHPAFANAKQFALLSGRSVTEVRRLCKTQVIPNEKSGRDYLIDTEAALEILKERAANFAGHKYQFIPITTTPRTAKKLKKGDSFLDKLDQLIAN